MSYSWFVRCAVVVVSAALVAGTAFVLRSMNRESDDPTKDKLEAFREEAEQAGISFRMFCLPGEQGENFKVNMYDHGCGVAVGDFSGTGRLDLVVNNFNNRAYFFRSMSREQRADWPGRTWGMLLGDLV